MPKYFATRRSWMRSAKLPFPFLWKKGDKLLDPYLLPLTLSLKTPEDMNTITFRGASIKSSPVTGFLPLRFPFSSTQNFPNPLIRRSSPPSRVFLRISRRESITWAERSWVKPQWLWMVLAMWALVRVTGWASFLSTNLSLGLCFVKWLRKLQGIWEGREYLTPIDHISQAGKYKLVPGVETSVLF